MPILNQGSQEQRDFLDLLVWAVEDLAPLAEHLQFRAQLIKIGAKANTHRIRVLCHQAQHPGAGASDQDGWVWLLDKQRGSSGARELVVGALKRLLFA